MKIDYMELVSTIIIIQTTQGSSNMAGRKVTGKYFTMEKQSGKVCLRMAIYKITEFRTTKITYIVAVSLMVFKKDMDTLNAVTTMNMTVAGLEIACISKESLRMHQVEEQKEENMFKMN